jgi:hypothetical protein
MRNASPSTLAALLAVPLFALSGCAEPAGDGDGTGLELVPGQRSEAAFPDAAVEIVAPEEGAVLDTTSPAVELQVTGFELGASTPGAEARGLALSDGGQHVHLIVDDRPYQAVYDVSAPVELAEAPLEPGVHLLRAFPSRQWHESVKSPGAFAVTQFVVGDTAGQAAGSRAAYTPGEPLLTYSRPKGTYEGADADSVMVDFYVTNAELGPEGHKVRVTVNDTTSWTIERWAPHYLVGLADGQHTVRLELLDQDLEPVPGDFNATERTITVVGEAGEGTTGEEGGA